MGKIGLLAKLRKVTHDFAGRSCEVQILTAYKCLAQVAFRCKWCQARKANRVWVTAPVENERRAEKDNSVDHRPWFDSTGCFTGYGAGSYKEDTGHARDEGTQSFPNPQHNNENAMKISYHALAEGNSYERTIRGMTVTRIIHRLEKPETGRTNRDTVRVHYVEKVQKTGAALAAYTWYGVTSVCTAASFTKWYRGK